MVSHMVKGDYKLKPSSLMNQETGQTGYRCSLSRACNTIAPVFTRVGEQDFYNLSPVRRLEKR